MTNAYGSPYVRYESNQAEQPNNKAIKYVPFISALMITHNTLLFRFVR